MAGRVAVLGTERGPEGVDVTQRQCTQLAFQLSRHGQVRVLAEEVLLEVHLAVLRAGHVVQVKGSHIEHLAGTFRIRSGNQRSVQIEEAPVVEVFVDGESHGMAETEHAAEVVGARTQVRDVTQELHAVTLLLQRILLRIGSAVKLDRVGLHLHGLSLTLRFHQRAFHMDTRTRRDLLHQLLIEFGRVRHHLQVETIDPSFTAMKATLLFPRLVRTQPFTVTGLPIPTTSGFFRISFILYFNIL